MYGLAGAHRSGKTTTAKLVAERLGLPFFDGSFGKLAAELGYNSVDSMTVERRIEMQEKCLALHIAKIRALPRPCVTDRTPLDFIAYATADVAMHAGLPVDVSRRIWAYVENCLEVTREHYGAIALLTPLPSYEAAEGKPPECLAYQAHVQLLVEGAMFRLMKSRVALGRTIGFDLEERVTQVAGHFADHLMELDAHRAMELVH